MARQLMREDTRPSLILKYDRCDLAPAIATSTGLPNQTSAVNALPGNLPTTRLCNFFDSVLARAIEMDGSDPSCDEQYALGQS